ncbi:MAG: hypothetical protein WDW38_011012 [Sanguina aurantia]
MEVQGSVVVMRMMLDTWGLAGDTTQQYHGNYNGGGPPQGPPPHGNPPQRDLPYSYAPAYEPAPRGMPPGYPPQGHLPPSMTGSGPPAYSNFNALQQSRMQQAPEQYTKQPQQGQPPASLQQPMFQQTQPPAAHPTFTPQSSLKQPATQAMPLRLQPQLQQLPQPALLQKPTPPQAPAVLQAAGQAVVPTDRLSAREFAQTQQGQQAQEQQERAQTLQQVARQVSASPAVLDAVLASSATAPVQANTTDLGSGLAQALAGLSKSQLNSLAGLLGQAVGATSTAGPAAAANAASGGAAGRFALPPAFDSNVRDLTAAASVSAMLKQGMPGVQQPLQAPVKPESLSQPNQQRSGGSVQSAQQQATHAALQHLQSALPVAQGQMQASQPSAEQPQLHQAHQLLQLQQSLSATITAAGAAPDRNPTVLPAHLTQQQAAMYVAGGMTQLAGFMHGQPPQAQQQAPGLQPQPGTEFRQAQQYALRGAQQEAPGLFMQAGQAAMQAAAGQYQQAGVPTQQQLAVTPHMLPMPLPQPTQLLQPQQQPQLQPGQYLQQFQQQPSQQQQQVQHNPNGSGAPAVQPQTGNAQTMLQPQAAPQLQQGAFQQQQQQQPYLGQQLQLQPQQSLLAPLQQHLQQQPFPGAEMAGSQAQPAQQQHLQHQLQAPQAFHQQPQSVQAQMQQSSAATMSASSGSGPDLASKAAATAPHFSLSAPSKGNPGSMQAQQLFATQGEVREFRASAGPASLPAALPDNATRTLFVEDLPLSVTRREMAHIWRPSNFPGTACLMRCQPAALAGGSGGDSPGDHVLAGLGSC